MRTEISFTHSFPQGTRAHDVPDAAAGIFQSAGWRQRDGFWLLASSVRSAPRTTLVRATVQRLEQHEFACQPLDLTHEAEEATVAGGEIDRLERESLHLSPATVQARIDRLESRQQLTQHQEHRLMALHRVRSTQIGRGERSSYTPDSLCRGDRIRTEHSWCSVLRTNRRWAAVEFDDGSYGRIEYARILDHMRPR